MEVIKRFLGIAVEVLVDPDGYSVIFGAEVAVEESVDV